MNAQEKEEYILRLDNELLKGGVMLSEWCSFVVRKTDIAFIGGANLATIITAVSAIETYLRSEYPLEGKDNLYNLINSSLLDTNLKKEIHDLRKYRNKWVHISDPREDQILLNDIQAYEKEIEKKAISACRTLRCVLYENQCT